MSSRIGGKVEVMTGYRIENKKDRLNAFSDDQEQHFESLEEARSWRDELWESVTNETAEEEQISQKADYIVAYYKDGVQRGEWPLFED